MGLLLDIHALIEWLTDNPRLRAKARAAIVDATHDVFVSAATAWEMATKVRRGRLMEAAHVVADFHNLLDARNSRP